MTIARLPLDRYALCTLLLVCSLGLTACEDIITLDLKTTEPQVVIEASIYEYGSATVSITRTTDFYRPNLVESVSGAQIIISDNYGRTDTLKGSSSVGQYADFTYRVRGTPGRTYHVMVLVEGHQYEATSSMPAGLNLDSLTTEYQPGGGIGAEQDAGYRVHVFFRDNPGIHDYGRVKLWRDGVYYYTSIYLYDGKFSDGNPVDYNYFFDVFKGGSYIDVQLISMEKSLYDYFSTLSEVIISEDPSNFLDASPANPTTNWSGGALGYFGAFAVSHGQIVLPDSTTGIAGRGSGDRSGLAR